MKRIAFLLLSYISVFVCLGDYSDYYKVYYQGRELQSGETIVCDNAYEYEEEGTVFLMYDADINVINQLSEPGLNRATIEFNSTPTQEEWNEDSAVWGNPKLCYYGGDENGEMASCMGTTGIVKIPDNSYDCFNWQFQVQMASIGVRSEYTLELKAAEGSLQWNNYSYIPDSEFYVTVIFYKDMAGIEALEEANNSEVTCYTLDGRKVNTPGKGLFIEKRGGKTIKVLKK